MYERKEIQIQFILRLGSQPTAVLENTQKMYTTADVFFYALKMGPESVQCFVKTFNYKIYGVYLLY